MAELYLLKKKELSWFLLNGKTRQHSILNGLKAAISISGNVDDIVIIHDAVRPLVSDRIIEACIEAIGDYDGAMPAVKVKDTIYQSHNGMTIDSLLNRSELYAGQSPEAYFLLKYYAIHQQVTEEQLSDITGSSVIAIQQGLRVKIISGEEQNFKITTIEDLKQFEQIILNN